MCENSIENKCSNHQTQAIARRRFIKLASLGAGMSLVSEVGINGAMASGKAKALLLSCMDYRLVDDLVKFMDGHELQNEYDHVVLAGAALGATHEKFLTWHETFWQHLAVAIQLHQIESVIVIDHRDCGAFRLALGAENLDTPEKETAAHAAAIKAFATKVAEKQPTMKVYAYLMGLDGTAEPMATY